MKVIRTPLAVLAVVLIGLTSARGALGVQFSSVGPAEGLHVDVTGTMTCTGGVNVGIVNLVVNGAQA